MEKDSIESTVSSTEEALSVMAETEGPSPRKTTIIAKGEAKAPDTRGDWLGPATDPRAGRQKG